MALNRKYAALPDLDSAPDIYETPELTDDNSTIPTTAARHSDDEIYDGEDATPSISRSRLRIDEARSRFSPAHINASGTDFSDRIDGKRRSYKASRRRRRILQDGTVEMGDLSSDDEDEESLERRIARLRREVEEAKDEYAKRESASAATNDALPSDSRLDSLSQVLDDLSKPAGIASTKMPSSTPPSSDTPLEASIGPGPTYTITYAPTYEQTHALAKAADFDRRLVMLERGLGISSSSISEAGESGLPRAIIPTLDSLEKQISTLSQASTANLDAISRRVRTLALDQEKLKETREKAKAAREEMGKHGGPAPADVSDQEVKINALYAILPTIENLTPMLPPLLDRLRTLRAIHADAATASQTLDRIEKQQAEMTTEIKLWSDGLQKLESTIQGGDKTMKGNMDVMEGWVKELQQRMEKLT